MTAAKYFLNDYLVEFPSDKFDSFFVYEDNKLLGCDYSSENFDREILLDLLSQYINELPMANKPNRGDLISIPSYVLGANEDDIYWTGEKAIDGSSDGNDDYRHVPNEFWGGEEFEFDHWRNFNRDSYAPVRHEYLMQMLKIEYISCKENMIQFSFILPNPLGDMRDCIGYVKGTNFNEILENVLMNLIANEDYICMYDGKEITSYNIIENFPPVDLSAKLFVLFG